jgi:hypothetical protein
MVERIFHVFLNKSIGIGLKENHVPVFVYFIRATAEFPEQIEVPEILKENSVLQAHVVRNAEDLKDGYQERSGLTIDPPLFLTITMKFPGIPQVVHEQ